MPQSAAAVSIESFAERVAALARESGAFEDVSCAAGGVRCVDPIQPAAEFRVAHEEDKLWVMWASRDRYLSQSIEAEVKWTGDDIDDLIAEEVEASGWTGPALGAFQHFRSPDLFYVFRSELPLDPARLASSAPRDALLFLQAYQAAFRNLGGMKAQEG